MTPVSIVAGFLGAGKTTLINHLLAGDHGRKITVLVNDFGQINIDAELILRREREVMELSNGCICCSIQGDLVAQLQRLLQSKTPPEHLVIEASGLSQPGRIASVFGYPALRPLALVDAVITLLDAANLEALSARAAQLVRDQIEAADLIVMTKCDLIERPLLDELKERWLLPGLAVIEADHGKAPVPLLLGNRRQEALAGDAHHHDHDVGFFSVSWTGQAPLSYPQFKAALEGLPAAFIRAKGLLYCSEFPGERIVFHKVGSRLTFEKTGPWTALPSTRVVAIAEQGASDEASFLAVMQGLAP